MEHLRDGKMRIWRHKLQEKIQEISEQKKKLWAEEQLDVVDISGMMNATTIIEIYQAFENEYGDTNSVQTVLKCLEAVALQDIRKMYTCLVENQEAALKIWKECGALNPRFNSDAVFREVALCNYFLDLSPEEKTLAAPYMNELSCVMMRNPSSPTFVSIFRNFCTKGRFARYLFD